MTLGLSTARDGEGERTCAKITLLGEGNDQNTEKMVYVEVYTFGYVVRSPHTFLSRHLLRLINTTIIVVLDWVFDIFSQSISEPRCGFSICSILWWCRAVCGVLFRG